jgi:hypothetical protein
MIITNSEFRFVVAEQARARRQGRHHSGITAP